MGFIVREFTNPEPIVQLRILLNRNFGVGTLIATLYGFSLYGVTALLPLFLQTLWAIRLSIAAWPSAPAASAPCSP